MWEILCYLDSTHLEHWTRSRSCCVDEKGFAAKRKCPILALRLCRPDWKTEIANTFFIVRIMSNQKKSGENIMASLKNFNKPMVNLHSIYECFLHIFCTLFLYPNDIAINRRRRHTPMNGCSRKSEEKKREWAAETIPKWICLLKANFCPKIKIEESGNARRHSRRQRRTNSQSGWSNEIQLEEKK